VLFGFQTNYDVNYSPPTEIRYRTMEVETGYEMESLAARVDEERQKFVFILH